MHSVDGAIHTLLLLAAALVVCYTAYRTVYLRRQNDVSS